MAKIQFLLMNLESVGANMAFYYTKYAEKYYLLLMDSHTFIPCFDTQQVCMEIENEIMFGKKKEDMAVVMRGGVVNIEEFYRFWR